MRDVPQNAIQKTKVAIIGAGFGGLAMSIRLLQIQMNDFVILETSDLQKAADFKANIGLISDEMGSGNLTSIIKNITAGGILVYPENMEETVDEAENYFRKLFLMI